MKFRFRHQQEATPEVTRRPEPAGSEPEGDVIDVRLFGDGPWRSLVDAGLGGGVRVDAGAAPDVVVVVGERAEVLVAARDAFPGALTLAVVPFERSRGATEVAVTLFGAGADACLIAPAAGELTAQLVALVRRRGLQLHAHQAATTGHAAA